MSIRKNERGAVFVEASIVFPVCLVIIMMLLYLGNVYFQRARIEAIVVEAVLDGAAYCADPLLRAIDSDESHAVPGLGEVDYEPYRYAFGIAGGGSMGELAGKVSDLIKSRVGGMSTGLFSGMKPTGYDSVSVDYKSCFVASSISVDMSYKIELPVRLLGGTENLSMKYCTHTEVPVQDQAEFVRNVNMVDDILEATGVKEKIVEFKDKVVELFSLH